MTGSIPAIGYDQPGFGMNAGSIAALAGTAGRTIPVSRGGLSEQVDAATITQVLTQLQRVLADFLDGPHGAARSEALIRLLIGLLILTALVEQLRGSENTALEALASNSISGHLAFAVQTSTTTVFIEESTSVVVGYFENASSASAEIDSEHIGRAIDVLG